LKAAQGFVKTKRKEAEALQAEMKKAEDSVDTTKPSTVKAFEDKQKAYYAQKAVFEAAEGMIAGAGAGAAAADAEVEKVRFTRKISDDEKAAMKLMIDGYKAYKADAAGDQTDENKKTGDMLLQKLEDDAEFARKMWKRKMKKDPSDDNKFEYYNAVAEYDMISELAGKNSPAKAAKKQRKIAAAAEKARDEVAARLQVATSAGEVAKALSEATKGASKAAAQLAQAKTNDDMRAVLTLVAEDKKLAALLAEMLLAAKTMDDVAGAFSEIYVESFRREGKDENAIKQAQVESEVKKAVFKAEIAISDLKDRLDKEASQAKTPAAVDALL